MTKAELSTLTNIPKSDLPPDTPLIKAVNACPVWLQRLLLGALLLHALGVLSEPFRFFSRSEVRTGPEFVWLGETMKPYSQWLYMNHGYFFFAPNPGPSHLIQFSLNQPTGKQQDLIPLQSNRLPDRNKHWPRLLYHRYFMLAEFYTSRYAPQQLSDDLKKDVEVMSNWAFDKGLYDQIQYSIKESLEYSLGTEITALNRIERELPSSEQVLKQGWALNDPRLTIVLPETMVEIPTNQPADVLPSKPTGQQPAQ